MLRQTKLQPADRAIITSFEFAPHLLRVTGENLAGTRVLRKMTSNHGAVACQDALIPSMHSVLKEPGFQVGSV